MPRRVAHFLTILSMSAVLAFATGPMGVDSAAHAPPSGAAPDVMTPVPSREPGNPPPAAVSTPALEPAATRVDHPPDETAPASDVPLSDDPPVFDQAFDLPPEEDEPPRPPPARIDELSFDLTFEGIWRQRWTRTDPSGGWRTPGAYRGYAQTNRLERYAETFGVSTNGSLFGEHVARFDFTGRFGISQESFRESRPGPDLDGSPYGRALSYDLRTVLFPQGKLSVNLFASQSDDRIPRLFLPSYDRRRERFGAELLYNDAVLPMRLSFESSNENWISPDPRLLDSQESDLRRLDYEVSWLQSDAHQLRLTYQYADQTEQYSGLNTRFDTRRHYITLNDTFRFGSDLQHSIETLVRVQDEDGDLARDIFEFAPQLRLRHSDRLTTTYRFQHYRDSFIGQQVELTRGDFTLTHQITDALTSTLGVWAFDQDIDLIGDGSEWGITPTIQFSRENRWGRLTASASYVHSSSRLDGGQRIGVILAEAVTFRDPLPTPLAQPDVLPGTVLVTNADRTIVYQLGIDYTILTTRRNTLIRRIASGRIRPNETVFVAYQYDASSRLDVDRDRFDIRVEQAFTNGLTPYYAGSMQYESLSQTRLVPLIPRDIQRHRAGLRYRRPRWSASGEFEYNDDSIDPYRAGHLAAEVQILTKAPHTLEARANASYFHFDGAGPLLARNTRVLDVGMNYRYAISDESDATVNAAYRWEDDSLFGTTRGVDVTGALRWKLGYFTASVELEYDWLDLPTSHDRSFSAWLRLRREFPVVVRR
jgi:hypothetical protein